VTIFRVLGPVEVWADGRLVDAGQPRQRAILATLLVDAGRWVPWPAVVDRIWGEQPPQSARRSLHSHIARIRQMLRLAGGENPSPARIVFGSGGYRLETDPDEIDLHRFHRLVARAGEPRIDQRQHISTLDEALTLWRGEPLAGVEGLWAERTREGLRQEHLEVVVAWARAHRQLGNHEKVLHPLAELAVHHPYAEAVEAELMRALHALGRTAQALERYAGVRHRLVDDLGLEPGAELRALHHAILRGEAEPQQPSLSPDTAVSHSSRHVPRELPAPAQAFTGRVTELADLDKVHDVSTVVITAIDGMAGVGKTALAVRAAYQMLDRFPDGQIFIDLHGHTQGVAPIEPAHALDRMLRSLGVPGDRIPDGMDERAGLYRSQLADRRLLIVLDNAATESQVAPLLPGASGCLVLVTSRRRLAGLDHTSTLSLDTLPLSDAVALLRQCVNDSSLTTDPDLVDELVELCGRLPLAIRIAAARLRSHPTWNLAHLTQRLRHQQHRLAELAAGQRSVTAALDLSYQDLSGDQRRAYQLLGLHPGADTDLYATAALLDYTLTEAGLLLEQLLEAHLVQEPIPGRYRFHDLIRAHASLTANHQETENGRLTAVDRLLDYYRHTAAMAMDVVYPYEHERRPQVPPAATASPDLSGAASAQSWLDGELPNLLAAATFAAQRERPAHLLHFSAILHRHLRTRGLYHDAVALHGMALITARATGAQTAELEALSGLGHIRRMQSRYEEATDHLWQALQLARTTGDRAAELEALVGLGHVHRLECRYEEATDHYHQALQLGRETGNRTAELNALTGLGHMHRRHGRLEQSIDHYHQALRLAHATGNRSGELDVRTALGHIHRRQGRLAQSVDQHRQALQLAHATGHHTAEQNALNGLGRSYRMQGLHEQAAAYYQRLLDLAAERGDRNWQFEAWQGLGRLRHATGHPHEALAHHQQALTLATELGQPDDEARAHDGLAHAYDALQQREQAGTHWQTALHILTRLGVDQADDEETTAAAIRAHLTALGDGRSGP
jgi:DNA-binding SARP family transcriptional activator/Tfp pilus assembly protein PilF